VGYRRRILSRGEFSAGVQVDPRAVTSAHAVSALARPRDYCLTDERYTTSDDLTAMICA
jgi:hypothetical protein